MASNLTKRLDRLERIATELLNQTEGPVYRRDGQEIEGIDPERVVVIVREYVAAPERDDVTPPLVEPSGNLFGADTRKPANFSRRLEYPNYGAA